MSGPMVPSRTAIGSPADGRHSSALFAAILLPFAVLTHLFGELGALGFAHDLPVAFGAQHAYLALLLVASTFGASAIVRSEGALRGRTAALRLLDALPFAGRGAGFFSLCFALQAAFFIATQRFEGLPIGGGDVVTGLLAAAVTALLSSFAITRLRERILRFAVRLCRSWFVARRALPEILTLAFHSGLAPRRRRAVLPTRSSRPPPRFRTAA